MGKKSSPLARSSTGHGRREALAVVNCGGLLWLRDLSVGVCITYCLLGRSRSSPLGSSGSGSGSCLWDQLAVLG